MSLFNEVETTETTAVLRELQRELDVRKSLYPKWVDAGKIDFHNAQHRIRCIEKAIEIITKTRETK